MEQENVKVSIVIPVYNSAEYLESCVKSVLGQSYGNIEVLLVDDGSRGGSGELCRRFAEEDPRVKAFGPGHRGVGATRNYGIRQATGEYLLFVDSDDLCDPELVRKLVSARQEKNLVLCGLWMIDEPGNPVGYFREKGKKVYTRAYAADVLAAWKTNPLCGGVYCKLFHLPTLKEYRVEFEEDATYAEDLMFNLKYLRLMEGVILLPDMLYSYRTGRSGSLTEKNLQEADFEAMWQRRLQVCAAFEETFSFFGLEEQCRADTDAFYWLQTVDMIQLADRKMPGFSAFRQGMELLRRGDGREHDLHRVSAKDRLTLSLLRSGKDRTLWLYETSRRKIRKMRGRERGGN